jgi:hypothetical protein
MELPKSFISLLALIGLGVVLAGSGLQGMKSDSDIAGCGVAIVYAAVFLWLIQMFYRRRR